MEYELFAFFFLYAPACCAVIGVIMCEFYDSKLRKELIKQREQINFLGAELQYLKKYIKEKEEQQRNDEIESLKEQIKMLKGDTH